MLPYRIVLADDHVLVREAIRKTINAVAHLEVVGEANDGAECLGIVERLGPDMVILDLTMPGPSSIAVLRRIKDLFPNIKVLVLTMHKSRMRISEALSAGADGYILKQDAFEDLVQAIQKVRQGKNYVSPLLTDEIIDLLRGNGLTASLQNMKELSPREKDVLKLVTEGKSSREIADILSVSTATVYNYRFKIRMKMGIGKDTDLINTAIEAGLKSSTRDEE